MQDDPATDVIGYLRSVQKQLADMEARVSALEARLPDPKAQVQAAKELKAQSGATAAEQAAVGKDPEPKAKDRG